jgi:hypothetical protein
MNSGLFAIHCFAPNDKNLSHQRGDSSFREASFGMTAAKNERGLGGGGGGGRHPHHPPRTRKRGPHSATLISTGTGHSERSEESLNALIIRIKRL